MRGMSAQTRNGILLVLVPVEIGRGGTNMAAGFSGELPHRAMMTKDQAPVSQPALSPSVVHRAWAASWAGMT